MRIVHVDVAECPMPLPHVIRLGTTEIRTRDFVLLRIETNAGIAGEAVGYLRGTPVFEAVGRLAPRLIGGDPLMRGALLGGIDRTNVPGRAGLTRALSLLDIALWDVMAKAARLPLFQILGGTAREIEASAVAGYYMDRRSTDDIAAEVARRFDEGFGRVKIMIKGNDRAFDIACCEAALRLGGRIAADAHWNWSTLGGALRLCRDLDGCGLEFIEDPFSAWDWQLTHELQRQVRTPIAAGEDVYGAAAMANLVRGIGLLRVDATTCGGITGAIEAIGIAAAAGRPVFPHIFPQLHAHLGCAFPNVEAVEIIPDECEAEPLHLLTRDAPSVVGGRFAVSEEPGVGIMLDWEAIARFAHKTGRIE